MDRNFVYVVKTRVARCKMHRTSSNTRQCSQCQLERRRRFPWSATMAKWPSRFPIKFNAVSQWVRRSFFVKFTAHFSSRTLIGSRNSMGPNSPKVKAVIQVITFRWGMPEGKCGGSWARLGVKIKSISPLPDADVSVPRSWVSGACGCFRFLVRNQSVKPTSRSPAHLDLVRLLDRSRSAGRAHL